MKNPREETRGPWGRLGSKRVGVTVPNVSGRTETYLVRGMGRTGGVGRIGLVRGKSGRRSEQKIGIITIIL